MKTQTEFRPNWVIHPGASIADALEERGWTQREAALRLGVSKKFINDLIKGRADIQAGTAAGLSRVLGSTESFWLQLQAQYDAERQRLAQEAQLAEEHGGWLKQFPLKELQDWGWLPKRSSMGQQIDAMLTYFGVASPQAWEDTYAQRLVAFRTSSILKDDVGATAAWLRQGERQAQEAALAPWNLSAFRALLPELRRLTSRSDFQVAWAELKSACATAGVAVVLERSPRGCRASGATFFVGSERAVLMLSGRYKSDDHLWFSFFHEASHLVLHSKKLLFIEGLTGLDAEKEAEANQLAADLLIPPAEVARLSELRTEADIISFAAALEIAPGIVVGRLQHEGILLRSHFNHLKRQFEWTAAP